MMARAGLSSGITGSCFSLQRGHHPALPPQRSALVLKAALRHAGLPATIRRRLYDLRHTCAILPFCSAATSTPSVCRSYWGMPQ
jgi:hypothetical protein